MSNRFPGMDPYLEDPAFWEDFHRRFIPEIVDALLEKLPDSYDAHIDERIRLVQADSERDGSRLSEALRETSQLSRPHRRDLLADVADGRD